MNQRSRSHKQLHQTSGCLKMKSHLKSFAFPESVQKVNSENFLEIMNKIKPSRRILKTFSTNTNTGTSTLNSLCNNSTHQIVHKYALPGKTLIPKKVIHFQNLEKFNPKIKELMKRFASNSSYEHLAKIENKDMRGCKKNSILAGRMINPHTKRIRTYNFE